jgi:imidazolonepropionase-like amidohydrolase
VRDFVWATWVFDGLGGVTENGYVVIEDGAIVGVGQGSPESIPSDGKLRRFDSGFLMPGFIDAHNHLGLGEGPGDDEQQMADPEDIILERARRHAEMDLRCGVTTMRELGERDYLDIRFREAIDRGDWVGPKLITSGPWITPSHGHGSYSRGGAEIADGVEGVRVAVRRHIKAGVAVVKLMVSGGIADSGQLGASYYTYPEIKTGVDEAHNLGLQVAVHCYGGPGIGLAVDAGVDTIEHAARTIDAHDLDRIAKAGIYIVYTAGTIYGDERVKTTAPLALQGALKAGVRIGFGGDCLHGNFAFEAECAVEYGASTVEALVAMTSGSAGAAGVLDRAGTLEAGKAADLVVVDGNPLENIARLRTVRCVMKDGRSVLDDPAMLETGSATG